MYFVYRWLESFWTDMLGYMGNDEDLRHVPSTHVGSVTEEKLRLFLILQIKVDSVIRA